MWQRGSMKEYIVSLEYRIVDSPHLQEADVTVTAPTIYHAASMAKGWIRQNITGQIVWRGGCGDGVTAIRRTKEGTDEIANN